MPCASQIARTVARVRAGAELRPCHMRLSVARVLPANAPEGLSDADSDRPLAAFCRYDTHAALVVGELRTNARPQEGSAARVLLLGRPPAAHLQKSQIAQPCRKSGALVAISDLARPAHAQSGVASRTARVTMAARNPRASMLTGVPAAAVDPSSAPRWCTVGCTCVVGAALLLVASVAVAAFHLHVTGAVAGARDTLLLWSAVALVWCCVAGVCACANRGRDLNAGRSNAGGASVSCIATALALACTSWLLGIYLVLTRYLDGHEAVVLQWAGWMTAAGLAVCACAGAVFMLSHAARRGAPSPLQAPVPTAPVLRTASTMIPHEPAPESFAASTYRVRRPVVATRLAHVAASRVPRRSNRVTIRLSCGHSFSVEALTRHVREGLHNVSERGLPCPGDAAAGCGLAAGCVSGGFISEADVGRLVATAEQGAGHDGLSRAEQRQFEVAVASACARTASRDRSYMVQCPSHTCSALFGLPVAPNRDGAIVSCPHCHVSFCASCVYTHMHGRVPTKRSDLDAMGRLRKWHPHPGKTCAEARTATEPDRGSGAGCVADPDDVELGRASSVTQQEPTLSGDVSNELRLLLELRAALEALVSGGGDAVLDDARVFICDSCYPDGSGETTPITGVRYHCTECDDFDLCEPCISKWHLPNHDQGHRFERVETEARGQRPTHTPESMAACPVCMEAVPRRRCVQLSTCNHIFCASDLSAYVRDQLGDFSNVSPAGVPCPYGRDTCRTGVVQYGDVRRIVALGEAPSADAPRADGNDESKSSELLNAVDEQRFSRATTSATLRAAAAEDAYLRSRLTQCPSRDCQLVFELVERPLARGAITTCPHCRTTFCAGCVSVACGGTGGDMGERPWLAHTQAQLCSEIQRKWNLEQQAKANELKFVELLEARKKLDGRAAESVRQCPHCSVHFERLRGCDDITCPACSREWCWHCGSNAHTDRICPERR